MNLIVFSLFDLVTIYRVWKCLCKKSVWKNVRIHTLSLNTRFMQMIGLFFGVAVGIDLAGTVKNGKKYY